MERLNTLILQNVLDTSLTELIPELSRVPTLRNLSLHELNSEGIALLYQWLPTCKLEELTIISENFFSKVLMTLISSRRNNHISTIKFVKSTTDFIDQILSQLQTSCVTLARMESMTICTKELQPLPPCLHELIPRMERLNTLTLENVYDTSLTQLIPALSRVPTLTLRESKGIALKVLCKRLRFSSSKCIFQWLSMSFSNKYIKDMECQYCTTEFIGQTLLQLQGSRLSFAHVGSITVIMEPLPKPLPSCLSERIPRMERLNTLTLMNVLDTSLTELIPALFRVPTLRNLTLHELNSEGTTLLCQWLLTCQLEKLTLCEEVETEVDEVLYRKTFFCNNSMETIKCQYCTVEFINQILTQIPSLAQVKTLTVSNELHHQQPLPPCLPELIPRMERLNTLTLENVLDISLTKLVPALSRVPTLRNLTLHILNSEGIAHLCQWLPTCQLEKVTLPSLSLDHIEILSRPLTAFSSLKSIDLRRSKFTSQNMQAFVSMLQQNQSLVELAFSSCNIDSGSTCCLAKAFYHNTTLRKLDMSENPIGEMGALAIAEMLKHNTTLEELNLRNAEISSDGAVAVAEALHHNTTLRKLDMSGNPIGEKGTLAMKILKHSTTLKELDFSCTEDDIDDGGTKALKLRAWQ